MENQKEHIVFEQTIERGGGIDIHKSFLVAIIRGGGNTEKTMALDRFTLGINYFAKGRE